jgi:hypothetical protein
VVISRTAGFRLKENKNPVLFSLYPAAGSA